MARFFHTLHSLIFWSALILAALLLYIISSLAILLRVKLPHQVGARFCARILCVIAGVRLKVSGLENVPRGRGALIAINHPGFIDFLAHYAVFDFPFRLVVAYTFFKVPFFREMVTRMRFIPLGEEEGKYRRVGMDFSGVEMLGALRGGETLLVFPEGQRKKKPGEVMARFRTWTARVAQTAGIPIIPAALRGSETVLPKMRFIIHPGTIRIKVGAPLTLAKELSAGAATARLQEAIFDLYQTV
jgi:1-acyl-sn-glycerol-3-phosphate acyltransferase